MPESQRDRRRVAFVHQPWECALPDAVDGSIPLWIHEVSTRLGDRADVTIYGKINPNRPAVERRDGITYRGISQQLDRPLLRLQRLLRYRDPRRPAFASWMYHYTYAVRIARHMRRDPPDVIHVFNFSNFVPVFRRHVPAARIVLHMQCEWVNQLDRALIGRRLRCVDGIIGCSEFIAGRAREAFPDWPGRCACVPNGVHVERFTPPAGGPPRPADSPVKILFVGRISPEKGLHTLLEAFERLRQRGVNAELNILGPFGVAPYEYIAPLADPEQQAALKPLYAYDYTAELKRRVAALNGAARFLERRPNSELPQVYHQADILVNPSISEAFGMTVVEGMASGLPVVATRVGGMTELIEPSGAGRLVPHSDAGALADALEGLAGDSSLRAEMGRAGQAGAAAYAWERVAARLLAFYGDWLD